MTSLPDSGLCRSPGPDGFRKDLESLLGKASLENGSNTPDWILARYLASSLEALDRATASRDKWYGVHLAPGDSYFLEPAPAKVKIDAKAISEAHRKKAEPIMQDRLSAPLVKGRWPGDTGREEAAKLIQCAVMGLQIDTENDHGEAIESLEKIAKGLKALPACTAHKECVAPEPTKPERANRGQLVDYLASAGPACPPAESLKAERTAAERLAEVARASTADLARQLEESGYKPPLPFVEEIKRPIVTVKLSPALAVLDELTERVNRERPSPESMLATIRSMFAREKDRLDQVAGRLRAEERPIQNDPLQVFGKLRVYMESEGSPRGLTFIAPPTANVTLRADQLVPLRDFLNAFLSGEGRF